MANSRMTLPDNAARVRLGIVISHPIQYYSPWFRLLAQEQWHVRVFYLWDFGISARHDPGFGQTLKWDVDLLSGYDSEFVPNQARDPGTHHFRGLVNPTLRARLEAWQPDVVLLFGYNFRTHLGLIARSRWPLIFRGDSHLIDQPRVSFVKRCSLSWIYRRFAAITYVGQANHDYFRTFDVPDDRLFFAPHAIDTAHFRDTEAARAAAAELRLELGLEHRRVVMFAGKFVPAKQPVPLLQAFIEMAPRDWALVFVGSGPEGTELEALAKRHPGVTVRFLPFANQTEMPSRYLLADLFTLPSIGVAETWGLAVQESMQMGTPCLVSHRVGCQRDLVSHGETGWVFRADSPTDLRQKLAGAMNDCRGDYARFANAAKDRVAAYSYETATAGLNAAVAAAFKTGHSR